MHFDSVEDYWNFTRWLDRRITVTKLREELVDIVENDFEHLMSKLEHLVFINCLDVFQLSLELTTDEMCKFIQLSYDKWYSMRTPVNKPISWPYQTPASHSRFWCTLSGDMYYE